MTLRKYSLKAIKRKGERIGGNYVTDCLEAAAVIAGDRVLIDEDAVRSIRANYPFSAREKAVMRKKQKGCKGCKKRRNDLQNQIRRV